MCTYKGFAGAASTKLGVELAFAEFAGVTSRMKLKMIEEDIYSNLAVIPFTIDSFTWHSAEQFYQASKFTDQSIIMTIKDCPNPFRCAAIGQTRKFKIRDDWEDIKVSVMERAIRARFNQHPDLAEILK
jgi:ribA/ribD-fused uncharacterized protein